MFFTSAASLFMLASWAGSLWITFPVASVISSSPIKRSVVIVGAGPVGLATALTLAKSEVAKFDEITVVEKRGVDVFESEKAYQYLLDGRGQRCTDSLNLTRKFADMAVSSKQFTELTEILTDGKQKKKKLPVLINSGVEKYWLPRKVMIGGFIDAIEEHNQEADKGAPTIDLMFDTEVSLLELGDGKDSIQVGLSGKGVQKAILGASLVVGADGMNSFVRRSMAEHCADGCEESYIPILKDSESAGLNFKILKPNYLFNLPLPEGVSRADLIEEDEVQHTNPNVGVEVNTRFAVLTGLKGHDEGQSVVGDTQTKEETVASIVRDKENLQSVPERAYAIRGTGSTDWSRLSLGLLPVRDSAPRTCNFVSRPEHDIWKIHTLADMKTYMKKQFPQMSRPLSDFVNDEELDRFAASPPGTFPKPQYCPSPCGFVEVAAEGSEICTKPRDHGAAIVLLGDSLHAFPPDLGQGVNSGLEDVYELSCALQACNGELEKALSLFETKRMPEIRALIDLMVFGFPFQYNQGPFWKSSLSNVNFAIRLGFSKLLPFLFSPPAFFMIQDPSLSYSTILRRAHRTTFLLWAAVSSVFLWGIGLPIIKSPIVVAVGARVAKRVGEFLLSLLSVSTPVIPLGL